MNKYLLQGKLTAKSGHRDELASILLEASKLVSTAKGCNLYVIGKDGNDQNSVYVTEIWDSKDDHDNSLKVEGVKEIIMKAMPILDGQPTKGQELEILGGTGIK
jgi:quinol monooxygenase YgiN